MLSPTAKNKVSKYHSDDIVPTIFYEDIEPVMELANRPVLLVACARDLVFEDFLKVVDRHRPQFVVPPFDRRRPDYTSMAAERTHAQMPQEWDVDVGIVMPLEDQVEFIFWAQQQDYSPIIIPPDRRPRSWQIGQFFQHRVFHENSWFHLAGADDTDVTLESFPGLFTWGVEVGNDRPH